MMFIMLVLLGWNLNNSSTYKTTKCILSEIHDILYYMVILLLKMVLSSNIIMFAKCNNFLRV